MGNSLASRPEYNVNVYLLPLEDLLIYISDIGNRIDTERIKLKYVNLLHEIKHIWHRLESYQGCCEGIRKAYANPKNEKLLAEMFFETLRNAKLMGDCYRLCLEVSEAIRELACDVFEHHPVANLMIIKGDRSNNSIKICHHHNMHAIETSEKDQVSSHHSPSDMKGINPEVDLDVEMNKIDHHTNTHICLSALCIFSAFLIDFDMLKLTKPDFQNDFSYYRREAASSRMETIYKRKMNEASALCPNPAINNTMGCDFGEFNYKLTHSEGMLTKELPFDNSHAGVVSMWLGNNFPMTRLFKQEWDLNNKEDTSASNSVSDGRTSPNHIDITPCSSLETFGLLANICCSMALRGNPYLHQGALKQWYNKMMVFNAIMYDIAGCNPVSSPSVSPGVFTPGCFVKMSKIVEYVKHYASLKERTHLFSCIKYCSMTYLNKSNKAKIMQIMD